MSTLKPRNVCWIKRKTTQFDGFGRPTHSASRKKTKCAIVSLYTEVEKTSVRADSSASRGRAEESTADVRILLLPREQISAGDLIEIEIKGAESNITFQVNKIFRRPDVDGRIHHIDIEGDIWASE